MRSVRRNRQSRAEVRQDWSTSCGVELVEQAGDGRPVPPGDEGPVCVVDGVRLEVVTGVGEQLGVVEQRGEVAVTVGHDYHPSIRARLRRSGQATTH